MTEQPIHFIDHIQKQGVVLGKDNNLETVIKAMESFHVNPSVKDILNAFSTLKIATNNGIQSIHVREHLNNGKNDVKLLINGKGGNLINGRNGQPTHHVG